MGTEEKKRKFFNEKDDIENNKNNNNKTNNKSIILPFHSPAKSLKIELSEKQKKVLNSVLNGKSVFFTGAAGTGKSLLLNYIINRLKSIYSYVRKQNFNMKF